jgi:hypothetical protein
MWVGTLAEPPDDGDKPSMPSRGGIPAERLRYEDEAGEALELVYGPRGQNLAAYRVTILHEIDAHVFGHCPICLTPKPTSREHVPPESLGGRVMTRLCEKCNNGLGARVEPELLDWRDDAMRNVRASAGNVLGNRKLPRVLYRQTADGQFVLVPEGKFDPALGDMLRHGEFSFQYVPPDANRYRLAALKHAYLAACLQRMAIPETPTAEAIRRDLLAARDATSNQRVPTGSYAPHFPLRKTYKQPHGPSAALVLLEDPNSPPEFWILLAGTLLVPWPMADFPPELH